MAEVTQIEAIAYLQQLIVYDAEHSHIINIMKKVYNWPSVKTNAELDKLGVFQAKKEIYGHQKTLEGY